jgi:uncharacterized membrane protein
MAMMGYGRGFGMDAFGLLWLLGVVLFLVVIVVLLVLAVRYLNRTNPPATGSWLHHQIPPPPTPARPDPLEILRERFARGEITLEDFETAKRALGYPSSPTPPPPGPDSPPTG